MVYMKAKHQASRRTKNRLAEHGAHGLTEERRETASALFGGEPAILASCACGWLGWLPETEVEG
jgi:hypothetical protein